MSVSLGEIETLSAKEIRARLGMILMELDGFKDLYEQRVIQHLIPELADLENYHQNLEYHPEGTVYNHYCEAFNTYCDNPQRTEMGAWALLFHDFAKTIVAEWRETEHHHTFHRHEKVGGEIFAEKYRDGPIFFTEKEADTLHWVIRQHTNFYRVARHQKSLAIAHHPAFDLLCEVTKADCMRTNWEFHDERKGYFTALREAFPL